MEYRNKLKTLLFGQDMEIRYNKLRKLKRA